MKEYRSYLLFLSSILLGTILIYFLGSIILPFVLGLILAYCASPVVKRIQKWIPNWNLAVTSFLIGSFILVTGSLWFLGNQAVKDFARFNHAFEIIASANEEKIDGAERTIKEYITKLYPTTEDSTKEVDHLKKEDAMTKLNSFDIDFDAIGESFSKVMGFFDSGTEKEESTGLNGFLIFIYGLGYFFLIIYSFDYFEVRMNKYFNGEKQSKMFSRQILRDFNQIFVDYFRRRTLVVIISTAIFILGFYLIGIPGAIITGVIAGFLCYIPHFHYLALIPLSLCSWAHAIETDSNFFVILGFVFGVLVLVSVLEELIFFPKIMKNASGMNTAILTVSLALWTYLFGTVGALIAIPLTTLVLLYLDKFLLHRKAKIESTLK